MINIFGIGTDVVNHSRFKKVFKKNSLLKKRLFSKNEIIYCTKKKIALPLLQNDLQLKRHFLRP